MLPIDFTLTSLRAAALAYAAAGIPVFPLHGLRPSPNADGRLVCTCGNPDCKNAGKHAAPMVTNGHRDATTSVKRISRWWPDDSAIWNVGIATGRRADLYVVDVPAELDAPDGLPPTLAAVTGGGGHHLFYRYPSEGRWTNTSNALGNRVLTRGEGGYLIVAPSLHHSGKRYEWIAAAVAELPAAVLERLRPQHVAAPPIVESADFLSAVEGEVASVAPDRDESGDPFALFHGTPEHPARALRALADRLARAGVQADTILRVIVAANDAHCRGALSESEAVDVADDAVAAEVAKRVDEGRSIRAAGVIDEKTRDGQQKLRALRQRERAQKPTPFAALRAYLLTTLSVVDYDEDSGELQVRWHDDGSTVGLHPWADREIAKEVGRHIGSLSSFAAAAHQDAKGKTVVDVLRDFAAKAPARQREAEDSEPVALVEAILALNVWVAIGDEGKKYPRLVDGIEDEWLPEAGIGVQSAPSGHRLLIVSPARLAGGEFARSAQFRGRSSRELLRLLKEAPGYAGERSPRMTRNAGQLRTHCVDLTEFARITGRRPPAARDEATGPQVPFSANRVTNVTSEPKKREIDMFLPENTGDVSAETNVTSASPASPREGKP